MASTDIDDMSVAEIMRRWPATIAVFIDLELNCIGCPIGPFHTLADAAEEHGISLETLTGLVTATIARSAIGAGRAAGRRR